tara:strand:- start:3165 stop:4493 length:1329 start_codon:yes stop_codon:yes gene_type:complete
MSHNNQETNTGASRILFLSSADGNNLSGNPNLTTDFELDLKQSIVVPPHHAILMSLHRASIPHTFYNFQRFRNCSVNIALRSSGSPYSDISNLDIELEQGNYNALDLVEILKTQINNWLGGATNTQLGTITNPITITDDGLNLEFYMRFNRSKLKYEWVLSRGTNTITGREFILIFKWASGVDSDTSIKDEIGFIDNVWIDGITYDYYCAVVPSISGVDYDTYSWGAITNNGAASQDYYEFKEKLANDFTNKSYKQLTWSGNILNKNSTTSLPDGTTLPANTLKSVFSAIDVNFHIRSIYIKSNLTQHSVLNSKHGGRFSSILARIPNDVGNGDTLEVLPRDGTTHKLFLKVREIDRIFIRLTDLNNRLLDLNGLDWNLSLQFDFIEIPEINHHPPNLRQLTSNNIRKREFNEEERRLRKSGKKKELEEFLRMKESSKFINN